MAKPGSVKADSLGASQLGIQANNSSPVLASKAWRMPSFAPANTTGTRWAYCWLNALYPASVNAALEGAPEYEILELTMSPSKEPRTRNGSPSLLRSPRREETRARPMSSGAADGLYLFIYPFNVSLIVAQVNPTTADLVELLAWVIKILRVTAEGAPSCVAARQSGGPSTGAFAWLAFRMIFSATTSPLQLLVSNVAEYITEGESGLVLSLRPVFMLPPATLRVTTDPRLKISSKALSRSRAGLGFAVLKT